MTAVLAEQVEGLQGDVMALLLDTRKTAASIERLLTKARTTSTLFVRGQRLAELFGRRAAGLQERATNRSSQLSARKIQLLLLTKRLDHLAFLAGDEQPPQLQRVKAALGKIETLIRRWATNPTVEHHETTIRRNR